MGEKGEEGGGTKSRGWRGRQGEERSHWRVVTCVTAFYPVHACATELRNLFRLSVSQTQTIFKNSSNRFTKVFRDFKQ